MDGTGQPGSARRADVASGDGTAEHVNGSNGAVNGSVNGQSHPNWADDQSWSSAGSALEPGFEPSFTPWHATIADRRGIEALTGADPLTTTLVRSSGDQRPQPGLIAANEDPYADEVAQRSADFARHAAFDEPTPAQGTPALRARAELADRAETDRRELAERRELAARAEESDWAPRMAFTPFAPQAPAPAPPASAIPPASVQAPLVPEAAPLRPTIPSAAHAADPPAPPGLRPALPLELTEPGLPEESDDPPLAAALEAATRPVAPAHISEDAAADAGWQPSRSPNGLSLGARFGMAFAEPVAPPAPVTPVTPVVPAAAAIPVMPPVIPATSAAPGAPARLESLSMPAERLAAERAPVGPPQTMPTSDIVDEVVASAESIDAASADELPQRVPAVPDVPPAIHPVVDPDPVPAGAPQLSRIASHLRRDDVPVARPDGFDVDAVLHAVRGVAGVRDATLRTTANGAHHLRLDLAEGADPAAISRMVARMLQDQMGLDAAPAGPETTLPRIPGQTPVSGPPAPATLPAPRSGSGAAPPPGLGGHVGPGGSLATPERFLDPPGWEPREPRDLRDPRELREPRRRHPVSVPRRAPGELRAGDRPVGPRVLSTEPELPSVASPPPLPNDRDQGPRAIIEHVQTSTFGLDATVEVRLNAGERVAAGVASGPAVDAYVLRLCAAATAAAIDDLLREGTTTGESGRCFVEQATIVSMGSCDVAVVVVLLVCGGWVEQLAGSALVSGDPRRAVVRATLSAVNRRLAALLP